MNPKLLKQFVTESNRIEGIHRAPTTSEITEMVRFMQLPEITVAELEKFVRVYQPNALLRDRVGLNVRVGNHVPPRGGPEIREALEKLLLTTPTMSAWATHVAYETLHPFTDGNGRSGRALWAWKQRDLSLGFLHRFYYQTLAESRP